MPDPLTRAELLIERRLAAWEHGVLNEHQLRSLRHLMHSELAQRRSSVWSTRQKLVASGASLAGLSSIALTLFRLLH